MNSWQIDNPVSPGKPGSRFAPLAFRVFILWVGGGLFAGGSTPDPLVRLIGPRSFFIEHGSRDDTIQLAFKVAEGYHIQSNAAGDMQGSPTVLSVFSTGEIITEDPVFSSPGKLQLEGSNQVMEVFKGVFYAELPIRLTSDASPGVHALRARLRYQACDTRRCYFPRVLEFEIELTAIR